MLDGQCVENNLSDRWWTLVAYAPFEKDVIMYTKEQNISPENGNQLLKFESGWIFVEDGTLSYNINEFDLGDNFAIEADVKGEDLKRDNSENYSILRWLDFRLFLWWSFTSWSSFIQSWYAPWYTTLTPPSSLENDNFYIVRFVKEWTNEKLMITNENWKIIWEEKGWTSSYSLGSPLYIWNANWYQPWKWIIKNVRIYKKY